MKSNIIKTVHLPGYRFGLTVALDADLDDYAATTGSSDGFKVKKKSVNITSSILKRLKNVNS